MVFSNSLSSLSARVPSPASALSYSSSLLVSDWNISGISFSATPIVQEVAAHVVELTVGGVEVVDVNRAPTWGENQSVSAQQAPIGLALSSATPTQFFLSTNIIGYGHVSAAFGHNGNIFAKRHSHRKY
jgi:hypothetical protein